MPRAWALTPWRPVITPKSSRATDEHLLVRGADDQKDQSYVLGYFAKSSSPCCCCPSGTSRRATCASHAERLGLRTWDKPDSQDVCFIEASKGREVFLRQRATLHDREHR